MGENALAVEVREETGKGVARKLRAAKRIPAVLYGRGKASVPLSLDPAVLEKLLRASSAGLNTLIDLAVSGRTDLAGKVVIVKELQREPVRGGLLHADLYEVDLSQTIEVSVPIHVVGIAVGVSMNGGILDTALREIEIECLPRAIPSAIEVDVSALDVGESIHVRDLAVPAGVTVLSDADLSVVSVVLPAAEEAPAAAEAAAEAATPAEGEAAAASPADEKKGKEKE
ncbi:MAG: 50S ribosomal protein L25 [Deltaproteobacteria bacterium]|nr:50S ribosomal protein L25 [Deltaproteobacteria bacterium]